MRILKMLMAMVLVVGIAAGCACGKKDKACDHKSGDACCSAGTSKTK